MVKKYKKTKNTIQFTKIQKRIISLVKRNKSQLNYYESDERMISKNKDLISKIKNSVLCQVSDEFGTAICINEKGYLLTCAHAAPPYEDEKNINTSIYIFPSGEIIKALTLEKNEKIDLALLKIIEIYKGNKFIKINENKKFDFIKINKDIINNEVSRKNIFCIGNPGFTMYDEEGNLENNEYKPFWISFGKIKKYLKDEVYCTKDLGPLIHNCWTYWGHSGEPLFNFDGNIVGIHNSWNEKNGDRLGVSLLGIIKFISKYDFL